MAVVFRHQGEKFRGMNRELIVLMMWWKYRILVWNFDGDVVVANHCRWNVADNNAVAAADDGL